jgi:hypothetical protein
MTANILRISDAEYSAALAAGRTEGKFEIRAQPVRYVPERDAIEKQKANYREAGSTPP